MSEMEPIPIKALWMAKIQFLILGIAIGLSVYGISEILKVFAVKPPVKQTMYPHERKGTARVDLEIFPPMPHADD